MIGIFFIMILYFWALPGGRALRCIPAKKTTVKHLVF